MTRKLLFGAFFLLVTGMTTWAIFGQLAGLTASAAQGNGGDVPGFQLEVNKYYVLFSTLDPAEKGLPVWVVEAPRGDIVKVRRVPQDKNGIEQVNLRYVVRVALDISPRKL